ncbi:dihydrodipicolinate synthase family protein [Oleiharenicola lentus]|uniref:dihydrodipicolinate synthase family protein n=1 Tax=Oleiharenicola lentus TaxID=2508720 RepID=UPI003F67A31D
MHSRYRGLVAAPFTPFRSDLSVNLDVIPAYARLLRDNGVSAAFVCGTTGEGLSLTQAERMQVAEAWMKVADEKLRVIVHVGHNSLTDAQELTRHAAKIGASAVSAFAPCFFKPRDHDELVDWCQRLAGAAPGLPFYYYNIPSMTGVSLKVAPFLAKAASVIPSLVGVKYTHEDMPDYQECVKFGDGRYDILFGRDELLLEGWQAQALGAVGSTYNYSAPLYLQLIEHLKAGRATEARALQDKAIKMIAICNGVGVSHLAASKALMGLLGVDCGPTRPPVRAISAAQFADLKQKLERMGFFSTACKAA